MKIIDIQNQQRVKLVTYPDSQPHVIVNNLTEGEEVNVIAKIRSSNELIQLLEVSNAIDNMFARKNILRIPYLMAARSDRVMKPGDSVDLKVVADLINYCNFRKVEIFDVHSDVALQLIRNSVNISNEFLVKMYEKPNSILIVPDGGAVKKVEKYLEWNKNITDVVYCIKTRNMQDGKITLKVLEPEKCEGRNCVIIDDLADGANTFLIIANQIEALHSTLIVSHGIFSKGFVELEKKFDQIITTDSYFSSEAPAFVDVVKLNF